MAFQELIFQAELNRHEDPEFREQAWLLCGEDPAATARNIEELRNMIYERGECCPPRMDDAFLLRFLRARRSVPARAHRLMVRYCQFREQNPQLWRNVDWFELSNSKLGQVYEGVLFDRPDVGRLIILRLGKWDPDEFSSDVLIQGSLLMEEIGIMQPKLQILGGHVLIDCEGLTMKQIKQITPNVFMQTINVMGYGFPAHQRGIHVINCSRVFEAMFYFFRRLVPANDLLNVVHFHGYNLDSLHRYLDPECLPKRYGGHREATTLDHWLRKIRQYKNKDFDYDMRSLGYSTESSDRQS